MAQKKNHAFLDVKKKMKNPSRDSKGDSPLWQSPEAAPLAESEAEPLKGARGSAPAAFIEGAPKGVNWKIVRWTIFQEGEPCKGGRPLVIGLDL